MGKSKILTYLALMALLIARFPVEDFALFLSRLFGIAIFSSLMDTLGLIQDATYYLWEKFSFILAGIVILAHRDNLEKLRIDRNFLVLFAVAGILFCRYFLWPVGWIGLLLSGFITVLLIKKKFDFGNNTRPSLRQIFTILFLVFCFYWSFKILYIGIPIVEKYIVFILVQMPTILVEEITFRSLLWMYLEELGCSNLAIAFVQSLLFWFFHVYYMFSDPNLFWIQIPILGVFLGVLVWKYRSITLSSMVHILFNLR